MNIHTPPPAPVSTQASSPFVSVIDTSVLFSIFAANDYALANKYDYDPMELLASLYTPPRTLVIPRTVLQEVFLTSGKSYGISYDPKTKESGFTLPEKAATTSGKRRFRQLLLDAEKAGITRYYPSTRDMLTSGDLDTSQGGIIVVDSADKEVEQVNETGIYEALPAGGQTADKALHHLLHRTYDLEGAERTSNAHIAILSNDNGVIETCDTYARGVPPEQPVYAYNTRSLFLALRDQKIIDKPTKDMLFEADFAKAARQSPRRIRELERLLSQSTPTQALPTPTAFVSDVSVDTREHKHGACIVDTSMMMQLLNAPDGTLSGFKGYYGPAILERLSEGNRTLVIPHTVLRELLRTEDNSYGLYSRQDGSLALNTGDRRAFSPASNGFAQFLASAYGDGKVRLYGSAEAMQAAGECDGSQGSGIAIVNASPYAKSAPLNKTGEYPILERAPHHTKEAMGTLVETLSQAPNNSHIVALTHNANSAATLREKQENVPDAQTIYPYMLTEVMGVLHGQGWVSQDDADTLCQARQKQPLHRLQQKYGRQDAQTRLATWLQATQSPEQSSTIAR